MYLFQILAIGTLTFFYALILKNLFRQFRLKARMTVLFIPVLVIFSVGYILRLNLNLDLINLGFYLTDFTSFFASILFAAFLFLGQLKYWKK